MKVLVILLLLHLAPTAHSQVFMTRNGYAGFFSKTPLEDIKAENRQLLGVIDVGNKNLAFTCLVQGFLFRKALMQEHFNENYIESDKYPKASFVGTYSGEVNLKTNGNYAVDVTGKLTLHGVTQDIEVPAIITVRGETVTGTSEFKLLPGDFGITIPALVKEKIAKQIDVRIEAACKPK